MGETSLWDRIWPWFRHPVSELAAIIAFHYCERHDLEIHFAGEMDAVVEALRSES